MSYITWGQIADLAKKAGAKYPELVAAQFALESNWGASVSGKNNFFGIKGKGTKLKTREFIDRKEIVIEDEFMNFDSPPQCVEYLVNKWYKDYAVKEKRYQGVNNASSREEAAKMLVLEGYSTDPRYSEKLIEIMNKNTVKTDLIDKEMKEVINLKEAAKYFKNLKHQNYAWDKLQSTLTEVQLKQFAIDYRSNPELSGDNKDNIFPLNVPYFYQRDSKTGHGERSCQSSALAMAVEYINPSLIYDDDDYLKIVFRYGDTVSQAAQMKALGHLNLGCQFNTNGTEQKLIKLLEKGYPVPIGILHKGNINSPSGGGHWITLIGFDDKDFYVHDPFGELDLINGGYPRVGPTDGKNKRYSRNNLLRRWLINSNSDGWYWDLSSNKKSE